MMNTFLNTDVLPFCKGCGHDLIARNTTQALEKSNLNPLDVIIVTDIGCHGIIDKALNTHTVHGLHGRSVALGAGIGFGNLEAGKKIIVFIGDGGATIGLQHIMEAARLNLNLTVVLHNNYLYGMTGGQTSGLTPIGFNTTTSAEGNAFAGYDICSLAHAAGASYVSRIMGVGDVSDKLAKAFAQDGFSLVEVLEICPSYGVKLNPRRKLAEIVESSNKPLGEWVNERKPYKFHQNQKIDNLLGRLPLIKKGFASYLKAPVSLVISGSAGEGVQLAAGFVSKAAISCGLYVTQKGSYPVTVGVGFSTSEINLSLQPIDFHGINVPDILIITSEDGLGHNRSRIEAMQVGKLIIDSSLEAPVTGATVISHDFRGVGARNASIFAVLFFAMKTGIIPTESIFKIIQDEGKGDKLPVAKIKDALSLIK
jgi:2-oxoglutarate/2-oxoacid ferredoxin oxidoreductase subunit beta